MKYGWKPGTFTDQDKCSSQLTLPNLISLEEQHRIPNLVPIKNQLNLGN